MGDLNTEQLESGLGCATSSPSVEGSIDLLVARPAVDERTVLAAAEFVVGRGLVGDNYVERGNAKTPDGSAHPEAQLNLMNSRIIDLVADGDRDLWPLAGDQLFVDLDLSVANLPAGTRLAIGTAVIEVSEKPHTGCAKFAQRFGIDAARWINSDPALRLRGLNAMVIQDGSVKPGDKITKLN